MVYSLLLIAALAGQPPSESSPVPEPAESYAIDPWLEPPAEELPWEAYSSESPESESAELRAVLEDGFGLRSLDGEYEIKTHILGQFDFKLFSPAGQEPAARTGAYIPRTRIYFEGRLTEPFEYEVSLQRSLEGQFDLLDANFNARLREERLQLKVGRQLVPYSYAWYDHLEQYFLAPERALFPLNFGLSRATGASLWGTLGGGVVQYAVAGVDGRLAGLADNNTTADGVAYLNLRPFLTTERFPLVRFLNVGGSLAIGESYEPAEPLPLRTSAQASENDESAVAASAIFLDWEEDVRGHGGRVQGALHVACYVGRWTVECEWQAARFGAVRLDDNHRTNVNSTGFHAGVGCMLTGETVERRTTVRPLTPFDPRYGWAGLGAWELFVRYADLELSNEVFTEHLADPDLWTNQAFATDLGCNWYWNSFLKWTFDWQHSGYRSPVLVNDVENRFSRTNDLFWIRGQVYF